MKKAWCLLALLLAVVMATPASSTGQVPPGQMAPPQAAAMEPRLTPNAGASLAAALCNVVYFPVRFTVTVITAEVGGFTGWMTGGNPAAAQAVWESTDGQAYITPEVIEGREPLFFGHSQW